MARQARAQAGENLIGVGARHRGDFVQRHGLAQKFDFVANPDLFCGNGADIHGEQIHRHPPHHRHPAAGKGRHALAGQSARQAVGISERHGGEHDGPFCAERGSVANAFPLVNSAQLQDASRQDHRGSHGIFALARLGMAAIKADAGTHQIEEIGLAQEHPARRRQAGRGRRQHRQGGAEASQLRFVHGIVRHVGTGQVAHHQHQLQAGQVLAPARRQFGQIFGTEAQPVHAGIDMQHRIQGAASTGGGGGPAGDLGQASQHRDQAMGDQRGHGVGRRAVQHKDSGLGRQPAKGDAFLQPRHKKRIAAGFQQAGRDHGRAQAIGVGLDQRRHHSRAGQALEAFVIRGNRPQPHGQPGGLEILARHGRTMPRPLIPVQPRRLRTASCCYP